MKNTKQIGDYGEDIACDFLKKSYGYQIIDRNWKNKYCEIDIIAEKNKVIYFVEVKYRKTAEYGDGFEAIHHNKLNKLKFAAENWVYTNGWEHDYQILIASVSPDGVEISEI